jgi:Holliday junction resolvasome RuvABC endonuclease subunit
MVRFAMWQQGIPFALVPPSTLKLYTAGHGKATKAQMVRAVEARHGLDLSGVMVKDGRYDMADAFALAAMGYAWANRPLVTLGPPPPRASLMAVPWPSAAHPDPTTERN